VGPEYPKWQSCTEDYGRWGFLLRRLEAYWTGGEKKKTIPNPIQRFKARAILVQEADPKPDEENNDNDGEDDTA
jgi:hypothetical protein